MNNLTSDSIYIYHAYLGSELVYIGKGTGNRYKHITSGTSSCYKANRAHFLEPENVRVEIYSYYDSDVEALAEEERLIKVLKPEWDMQHVNHDSSTVIDEVRGLPQLERLSFSAVEKVLNESPMSVLDYLTNVVGSGVLYQEHKEVLLSHGFNFGKPNTDKVNARLQAVVNILEDKKGKVDSMPNLLKKHGVSKRSFQNYKEEFKQELINLGLLKK